MRLSSFGYLTRQGWKNMGANRQMSFACIGVLTACFVILGIASLFFISVDRIVDYLADQNEVVVTMKEELEDEVTAPLLAEIQAMPNVLEVEYISKADAFEKVKGWLDEFGNYLEGYEMIFPAKFNVAVEDLTFLTETSNQLWELPGVERVDVPVDLADAMITVKNGVTYAGAGLVLLLMLVSLVVISNTIRLTVFARRREISIMKYVGATNAFIRMPFFIEGMTVGIIAGLLASGIVCGMYYLVYEYLGEIYNVWIMGMMGSLLRLEDIWFYICAVAIVAGFFLGGIGTAGSVRKHLKV